MSQGQEVDDLLTVLPQVGAYSALVFAAVYAVRRTMRADGEMESVVKAQDEQINRLNAEITRKDAEIARLEMARKDAEIARLEERLKK